SPTVIIAAITAQIQNAKLPTHVEIKSKNYNLERDSVILLEQIRTLDNTRLTDKTTVLNLDMMKEINQALEISLGVSFKKMYDYTLPFIKKQGVFYLSKRGRISWIKN